MTGGCGKTGYYGLFLSNSKSQNKAIKNPNLSSGNLGYRRVGATRLELVTSGLTVKRPTNRTPRKY